MFVNRREAIWASCSFLSKQKFDGLTFENEENNGVFHLCPEVGNSLLSGTHTQVRVAIGNATILT